MSSLARESNPEPKQDAPARPERARLFDLTPVDLAATAYTRDDIAATIPHRFEMALLDKIVWASPDFSRGVGSVQCTGDEFWVRGHFPHRPMLPGVLMVEAGAQLSCWLWQKRQPKPCLAAFLRIENAVFRQSVTVGDEMFVLCQEIKATPRRFFTDIQGIVNDQICFEARISGMNLGEL
jgi:3-hydroxymyristoyl/3-hydroxydecanoyl-(acyl carrier protein) dehydratase